MAIDPAFVQAVAEGLGVKPSDDAAKSLAPDVEYRLREVVQVGSSVMFATLIARVCLNFVFCSSYGCCFLIATPGIAQDAIKFARHSKRTHITTADVNNALRMRNVRPIHGFSDSRNPARFV